MANNPAHIRIISIEDNKAAYAKKNEQNLAELPTQSTRDSLTGLANRANLFEKIQTAINTAEINQAEFAVLVLDLDRFKFVNHTLNHAVGDELLQAVAYRLKQYIGIEQTIARLGGDEFAIIFEQNKKDLLLTIKNILTLFHQPFYIANRHITLTASIGVSIYPKDGISAQDLVRNADSAMYSVKEKNGDNFQFHTPEMNIQNAAKFNQEMDLRHAILHNEFFLFYQPQFDLKNEKIVAVEALLRWQHPQKGVILPKDFIPLAEETGLIVPINEWVMFKSCEQNKAWQDAGFPPVRIAVNITAQQFKQDNLIDVVRAILETTRLKPEYLELELTENVLLCHLDVINAVTELKKLNISIAIDDFGTGYSSLSYLHQIPLDRLKIDASFIQHIQSATDDEAIIRAVIEIARSLNLEVVAEGVETLDQVNFLKKHQCGDIQGFYFSKPLTKNELELLFKNSTKGIEKLLPVSK